MPDKDAWSQTMDALGVPSRCKKRVYDVMLEAYSGLTAPQKLTCPWVLGDNFRMKEHVTSRNQGVCRFDKLVEEATVEQRFDLRMSLYFW